MEELSKSRDVVEGQTKRELVNGEIASAITTPNPSAKASPTLSTKELNPKPTTQCIWSLQIFGRSHST